MAAFKNGMKTIIIPQENLPDLAEVDDAVKKAVTFVPAATMDTVLRTALVRIPLPLQPQETEVKRQLPVTLPVESSEPRKSTVLRQ